MNRVVQTLSALFLAAAFACAQDSYVVARRGALALEGQHNFTEAEQAWIGLSKSFPKNPEPYARWALLEARQEHYDKAVPLYRRALALDPNVPGLRLNLALALFKGGQLKASIPELEALLKAAPPDSPDQQRTTILLGMAHYGSAEYPQAVPYLKDAATHDTQNLPLRLALAHSCLWSKQWQCVMDVYHEILSLNADSAEADMLAGEALDEMKDSEGSTRMFRAAVKANPKEPNVHFGLGYLLWTQKQFPEAVTEFQAELANDSKHAQAMLYLGDAWLQLNQTDQARAILTKAIELNPSLWLGHLDLGIIDSEAGRNNQALPELQTAERLKPDEVNVHWRLGKLYRAMGRKDQAKAEMDKAIQLNKSVADDLFQKMNNPNPRPPADQPGAPTSVPPQPDAPPASPAPQN